MTTVAFIVIGAMVTLYVVLDGFDLGVAAIVPLVATNDTERREAMQSIGPFWNGNEVWLIAAGATLFAFFPQAYATAFSGFYLPFMLVLWSLMGRGIAIELRDHYPSPMWHVFWDTCFTLASALLIVLFGVSIGNLVRGVHLDVHGYFVGTFGSLLNPYALLVALFAVCALSLHGARFLLLRVSDAVGVRARRLEVRLWIATTVLFIAVTIATYAVRGQTQPWVYAAGLVAIGALIGMRMLNARPFAAFMACGAFLAAVLVAAAGTMFPYLIPSFPAGSNGGIRIDSAATPGPGALFGIVVVAAIGLAAVVAYGSTVFANLAGKVRASG